MSIAEGNAALAPASLQASLPPHLQQQFARLPVIALAAGTPVFERNARCGGFPLRLSGVVRVYRPLANGRNIELCRVAPSEPCILSLGCMLGGGACANFPPPAVWPCDFPVDFFHSCSCRASRIIARAAPRRVPFP